MCILTCDIDTAFLIVVGSFDGQFIWCFCECMCASLMGLIMCASLMGLIMCASLMGLIMCASLMGLIISKSSKLSIYRY